MQTLVRIAIKQFSRYARASPQGTKREALVKFPATRKVFPFSNYLCHLVEISLFFSNSFFKLDFYDTPDEKAQKNYLTIILPTQQGLYMETQMQRTLVNIKKPKFVLDYVGDKEGFFIYWLKKRTFLDVSTFYMSAKFYNAKTGQFTKMMTGKGNNPLDQTNGPQSSLSGNTYAFDSTQYFYYTVKLDYTTQTYQVFNVQGQRMGTSIPIKWYEYVNPPQ